jgi:hypothetical protein
VTAMVLQDYSRDSAASLCPFYTVADEMEDYPVRPAAPIKARYAHLTEEVKLTTRSAWYSFERSRLFGWCLSRSPWAKDESPDIQLHCISSCYRTARDTKVKHEMSVYAECHVADIALPDRKHATKFGLRNRHKGWCTAIERFCSIQRNFKEHNTFITEIRVIRWPRSLTTDFLLSNFLPWSKKYLSDLDVKTSMGNGASS